MTSLKISGFTDYTEIEHRLFHAWQNRIEDAFALYGFMGFHPRPVESIEILKAKGGIAHQIYTLGRLQDGGMTDLALPFDRTVPLAAYIAAHRQELTYPFKRFDISHSFRGERAQSGRFRGFIQADIDVVEEKLSVFGESECIQALLSALQRLTIPSFTIYINHIEIPKALIVHMGCPHERIPDALRILDKMDKIGFERVRTELQDAFPALDLSLLSLLMWKEPFASIDKFQAQLPSSLRNLPGFAALKETISLLEDHSAFLFTPGMVRGLDYYTGLILETVLQEHPSFGSIASGGRYNNLIDSLNPKKTQIPLEGFGLSIGLTRLFDIAKRLDFLSQQSAPSCQIFVGFRDPKDQKQAVNIANQLRAMHITTDVALQSSSLKKQLAYANAKQIPFAFLLMGETFVIKKLIDGTQTEDIISLQEALLFCKNTILKMNDLYV